MHGIKGRFFVKNMLFIPRVLFPVTFVFYISNTKGQDAKVLNMFKKIYFCPASCFTSSNFI